MLIFVSLQKIVYKRYNHILHETVYIIKYNGAYLTGLLHSYLYRSLFSH